MSSNVEIGITLPVEATSTKWRFDDALAETGMDAHQALFTNNFELGKVQQLIKQENAIDNHQVGWTIHPQPGFINMGHRLALFRTIHM